MKKLMFAGVALWAFTCVLNAAPIVRIDFPCQNFGGHMTCLDELPAGVWLGERQTFYDKKKKGYTFPVFVDLAKATEFELTFKFEGTQEGHVRLRPELTGYADDGRSEMTGLQLLAFEIDGDKSFRAPGVFKSWYGVTPFVSATDKELLPNSPVKAGQKYYQVFITDGKTIKVHARFKK